MRSVHLLVTGDECRLMLGQLPIMVWRSGRDQRLTFVNDTWLRFTGRSIEEELGDGWNDGVHHDDRARRLATHVEHFERHQPFEVEYRLRRYDGAYRYVVEHGVPYDDGKGDFAGFLGSCLDIDERRRLDHGKGHFLSMMVHDLRTPLMGVKAFADGIRRKVKEGLAVGDDLFARMERQLERFALLLDKLGDAARLEEGRDLPLSMEDFDLARVVRESIELHESARRGYMPRGDQSGLILVFNVGDGSFLMRGDPVRVGQVVLNLLDNAAKYSHKNGTIAVDLSTNGTHHALSVRDEGIGVAEDEIPRLTRRYYRARNASAQRYPGIGLGLTIAHEVVERHGGTIGICSALGEGTTVTIALPAEPRAPSRPA